MHANYIVNVGGASASDVRAVVSEAQRRVLERFGIVLKREVKFIDTGTGTHN
jgi:UDP-N-acetylmuramate dehydrogenase